MRKMRKYVGSCRNLLLLFAALLCCGLTACDKLDDGGDEVVNDILPGTWAFSYDLLSEEEVNWSVTYDFVIFQPDGTCRITYNGGELTGTYRAGSTVIRIDGTTEGSSEVQTMLWRIRSLTKERIIAEYDFELDGQSITAIVTLERV